MWDYVGLALAIPIGLGLGVGVMVALFALAGWIDDGSRNRPRI